MMGQTTKTLDRDMWMAQAEAGGIPADLAAKQWDEFEDVKAAVPRDSAWQPSTPMAHKTPNHTIRAADLIRDMSETIKRCHRAMENIAAITTELSMIRKDMATLHGVALDP